MAAVALMLAPAHADVTAAAAPRAAMTFTLITGDRVAESAGGALSIVRGEGRSGMRFVTRRTGSATYVIPVDALGLVGAGRVDPRLFDIAVLRRDGYDDKTAPLLPVMVQADTVDARRGVAGRAKAVVTRDLPSVGLLALRADIVGRARLWKSTVQPSGSAQTFAAGVSRIWLDGKRRLADDVSNAQIGVPTAWQRGLTGSGVPVAVLDSGIDMSHPDLKGQVAETANFTSDPDMDDLVGHGTHVASIVAGSGAASGGRYRGVAPGARLMIGKVCSLDQCTDSQIIAGMQWAAERSRVINMSLGSVDTLGTDPVEQAVKDLTAKYDSLFVISAGNDGAGSNADGTIRSPGSVGEALTVGAVDAKDKLAEFSSRVPRVGDAAIKPDITAPGVNIVAAKAAHGELGDTVPMDGYTTMSGTSMAAPQVAGVAAILTQQHPHWSAARRKQAVMASAAWMPDTGVFGQGAGRVDVARAITQEVTVDGGSLSFGRQAWPHTDDKPLTKRVTYRNSSTKAVRLKLVLNPARPGFRLAARHLTVPAGGSASTTLRVDTRVPGPNGILDGRLLATAAGSVQAQSPFAVDKEIESYTVTFKYRNRNGSPADTIATVLHGLDVPATFDDMRDGSAVTFRVPRGTYGLAGFVFKGYHTEASDDDETTTLGQPSLVVDRALTLQMDARKGKAVKVTVPPTDAASLGGEVNLQWPSQGVGADVADFEHVYSAQVGSKKQLPGFFTSITGTFARAGRNSPYLYELYFIRRGKVPDGFMKAVRNSELSTISASYTSAESGSVGTRSWQGTLGSNANWSSFSGYADFDMPFQRTELVSAAPGLGWETQVVAESPAGVSSRTGPRRTYPVGQVTKETWHLEAPVGK